MNVPYKATLTVYGSEPDKIGLTHALGARGFLNYLRQCILNQRSEIYLPGITGPFSNDKDEFFVDSYLGEGIKILFLSKSHDNVDDVVRHFQDYRWLEPPSQDDAIGKLRARSTQKRLTSNETYSHEMYCSVNVEVEFLDESKLEQFKDGLEAIVNQFKGERIGLPLY